MSMNKFDAYGPVILRLGVVLLFLWFGFSQIVDPMSWVSYLPDWTKSLHFAATQLVFLNGLFEVTLGFLIAIGFFTRIASLLLALHLFVIAYEIGYDPIGVRDFAIAMSTLSLAFMTPDHLTLDSRMSKPSPSSPSMGQA